MWAAAQMEPIVTELYLAAAVKTPVPTVAAAAGAVLETKAKSTLLTDKP
jgi:hypothetical protein